MLKICCVCGKIEHEGIWMTGRVTKKELPVSHGYCPHCFREAMADVDQYTAISPKGAHFSLWANRVGSCG